MRDIWLSTDEIKAIRDVKVSRENRIRKYLRNLYMFIHLSDLFLLLLQQINEQY